MRDSAEEPVAGISVDFSTSARGCSKMNEGFTLLAFGKVTVKEGERLCLTWSQSHLTVTLVLGVATGTNG
jgi:hypothetical protein